jgi:hypothetical protein
MLDSDCERRFDATLYGKPISAIHPNAVAKARNEIVEEALNKLVKES